MTDEQKVLTVARALGLGIGHYIDPRGNDRYYVKQAQAFAPLADPQWTGPMMVWLVERGMYIDIDDERAVVWNPTTDPWSEVSGYWWTDHPTKQTAILRCLCEAVARVAEEEKCPPHKWSRDGETCVKCGQKDWIT